MWCLAAGSAAEPLASLPALGRRRLPHARAARPPCLAGLAAGSAAAPPLVSTRLRCEAAPACLAEAAALWGQYPHASTNSRHAAALRSGTPETLVHKLLLNALSKHLITRHQRKGDAHQVLQAVLRSTLHLALAVWPPGIRQEQCLRWPGRSRQCAFCFAAHLPHHASEVPTQ